MAVHNSIESIQLVKQSVSQFVANSIQLSQTLRSKTMEVGEVWQDPQFEQLQGFTQGVATLLSGICADLTDNTIPTLQAFQGDLEDYIAVRFPEIG